MEEIEKNNNNSANKYIFTQDNLKITPKLIFVEVNHVKKKLIDSHSHTFCELFFVKSGCGEVIIGKRKYKINQGDIVICNPKHLHMERAIGDAELVIYVIAMNYFKLPHYSQNVIPTKNHNPIIPTNEYYDMVLDFFELIEKEVKEKEIYCDTFTKGILITLISLILRLQNIEIGLTDETPFSKAKDYIDEHYRETITLDDLCEKVFISKFYLSRSFKEHIGISPSQYIQYKRMEEAKILLKSDELSIKKIAQKVGFIDEHYFSVRFKNYEHISPSEYRKQNKINIEN